MVEDRKQQSNQTELSSDIMNGERLETIKKPDENVFGYNRKVKG
jgi:hypothetical protein